MFTRAFAVLAVSAVFSATSMALDPQLSALAMPGAKVLAGVNVEQAKATPFGQYVLSRFARNEAALQQLQDATGFDPRRDVREILLASTGDTTAGHPPALALVRGSFDIDRISAAAQAKGQTPETYNGITILSDTRRHGAVAFLAPDLAVAGNADDVRAAIDRRDTPTVLNPALSTRAGQLSATQDAWLVSLVPPPVSGTGLPDPTLQGILNSGALNSIQQTSGGVKFGANVDVTAEAVAATGQDANTLASIARLLASLAQSNAQGTAPAALLQSLTVATSGNTVQLALSIPESLVEQLPARRSRHAGTALRRRR